MKKLLIGLLALTSLSAFAVDVCKVKRNKGQDRDLPLFDGESRQIIYVHNVICTDDSINFKASATSETKSYLMAVKGLLEKGYEFTPEKGVFVSHKFIEQL